MEPAIGRGVQGRRLNSSTFQLNLSRLLSLTPPTEPSYSTKRARSAEKCTRVSPWFKVQAVTESDWTATGGAAGPRESTTSSTSSSAAAVAALVAAESVAAAAAAGAESGAAVATAEAGSAAPVGRG